MPVRAGPGGEWGELSPSASPARARQLTPQAAKEGELNSSCNARRRLGRRPSKLIAAVAAALCVTAPAAALSSEPSVDTRLALRSGGAPAPGNPEITDVICRRDCIGLRSPVVGGLIEVTGMGLADSVSVSFPGADGRVLAPVTRADEARAFARVPQGATDGRVRVRGTYGSRSDLSEASFDIRPRSELGSAGVLTLLEGAVKPKKTYLFGTKPPILRYVIASNQRRNDLRVDVIDTSGAVVRSFFRNDVPANSTQSIRWDARAQDKSPVRDGRYSFRIAGQTSGTAQRSRGVERGGLTVAIRGHIFPIRGPHDFGGSGSGFGAARSGHSHQGHDVFGDCGTPMVAARAGRVRYAGYQSSAGYYVVIDGRGSGRDMAYMHLLRPSRFATGEKVRTGQRIGEVGETGNAVGCHLHFEIWTAPGWYVGGSPIDPLPSLRRWDAYS